MARAAATTTKTAAAVTEIAVDLLVTETGIGTRTKRTSGAETGIEIVAVAGSLIVT